MAPHIDNVIHDHQTYSHFKNHRHHVVREFVNNSTQTETEKDSYTTTTIAIDTDKVYESVLNELNIVDDVIDTTTTNTITTTPTTTVDENINFKRVEYRCQAQSSSFGLIDHYFLVIDDKEYHLGFYRKGNVLPKGTTKGSHTIAVKDLCTLCCTKLFANLKLQEDKRLIAYFPFLNCETLATGFSVQSLGFLSIPLILILLVKGLFLYALLVLLSTFVILLCYSKFTYCRTKQTTCKHLMGSRKKND